MATILDRGDGRRAIQFESIDGQRRTVGLGKCPKRDAESIRSHLETILASKMSGRAVTQETAEWIGSLNPKLADKLTKFGLIETAESEQSVTAQTLVGHVADYIAKRVDTKPATLIVYRRCLSQLTEYFKAKRLDELTAADAKDFARWMRTKPKRPLAENTARRMMGFARQFLNDAVERELIGKNPFLARDIKVSIRGNAERFHFISRDDAAKVLEACPDAQWRLIFALSRFGGLRCPSEHLALK